MKQHFKFGLVMILLTSVQPASSFDLRFLRFSPVRDFTTQDWDMAKAAAREALQNETIGESVSWNNPDSGNSGDLKTTGSMEKYGTVCKTLQITNRARGLEGRAEYVFCKQSDGTWKIDTPPSK